MIKGLLDIAEELKFLNDMRMLERYVRHSLSFVDRFKLNMLNEGITSKRVNGVKQYFIERGYDVESVGETTITEDAETTLEQYKFYLLIKKRTE